MKLADIKTKAKDMGVKIGKLTKKDLILKIQESEGNEQCYGISGDTCGQMACSWREDCLKEQ